MIPGHLLWLTRFPLTPTASSIASTWCRELGVARIGIHDNLFDLGVHSLLLIRVHARLHEQLGREVPIVDLLSYPTVYELARHLDDSLPEGTSVESGLQRARLCREAARRRPGGESTRERASERCARSGIRAAEPRHWQTFPVLHVYRQGRYGRTSSRMTRWPLPCKLARLISATQRTLT